MNELLMVKGILPRLADQKHLVYPFYLGQRAESLHITFAYSPKQLEDQEQSILLLKASLPKFEINTELFVPEKWADWLPLKNLLTLSLDDPAGFRGAAHRHPNEQHHILAEAEASPGFVPGPLLPGLWQVTLSVHAVVTDECSYCIRIWEGDAE